jgi:ribosomal protein L11 methyltransferase
MKRKPLVEITTRVSPEAEDAVSISFERIFGQRPSFYTDAETQVMIASLYLEAKTWREALRGEVSQAFREIEKCGLIAGPWKISVRKIRHEDWAESWKRHFKPIEIGTALLIKPSWINRKPKRGQAVVVLDPGLSFGTGQHATTSFCLEQIEKSRRAGEVRSFLDMGTGSGILAIAAAKLGYAPVEAFDFDPEAVRVSRENVRKNSVQTKVLPVQQDLTKLPLRAKRQFDLVCANLLYDLLIAEAKRIVNRLKPGGNLVLAGILAMQFPAVRRCYEQLGLKLKCSRIEKEWQSACFSSGR